MELWRARNPIRNTYNNLKGRAKQRGVRVTITFEQFKDICESTNYIEEKGHNPESLSLDRIDPNKGYEPDNIQVITLSENSTKGNYEKWVTTKDGRRIRIYQIGEAKTMDEVKEERDSDNWEPPQYDNTSFTPTENEPF